jgi:CO/xanthine dehydrogenase Mo-binding subunit
VEGAFETGFIEHAYIEPEAGFAVRVGDRLEVQVTTQSPHLDRTELEAILGLREHRVRILPTAVGGGFGSKLDLSVQPYVAIAAWLLDRPVRIAYTRPESMRSTTKRHPARMRVRVGATREGRLLAMDFEGEFNTGAYASWGSTVANRVPVHAGGPYVYEAYRARTVAVHTNGALGRVPRFGVPQSTIASECLLDELADALGSTGSSSGCNAITAGVPTVTGQVFEGGVGTATASRRCARTASARSRRRRRSTRWRPAGAAASASRACGTAAATPRCRTPRRSGWACGTTGASCCSRARSTWGRDRTP